MSDVLVGIGLVLVIEGLLWAAAPRMAASLLEVMARSREQTLRLSGLAAVAAGVLMVWLVRG